MSDGESISDGEAADLCDAEEETEDLLSGTPSRQKGRGKPDEGELSEGVGGILGQPPTKSYWIAPPEGGGIVSWNFQHP